MKNNYFFRFIFCALFFYLFSFFTACSKVTDLLGLEKEHLEIILPDWPPYGQASQNYPALSKWIVFIKGKTIEKEIEVLWEDNSQVPTIKVSVPKNQPLCVTAQPVNLSSKLEPFVFFKEAGAIYPYDFQKKGTFDSIFDVTADITADGTCESTAVCAVDGRLQLTWENGFVACVMKQLMLSGEESFFLDNNSQKEQVYDFIGSFNWKKLMQLVEQKIEQSEKSAGSDSNGYSNSDNNVFYNPWQIEQQTLLESIAYKKITASTLLVKNVFSVKVTDSASDSENAARSETEYPTDLISKDSLPVANSELLSSFIPENKYFYNTGQLSLQKNQNNSFLVKNSYLLILNGKSAKNLSKVYISLPILKEAQSF